MPVSPYLPEPMVEGFGVPLMIRKTFRYSWVQNVYLREKVFRIMVSAALTGTDRRAQCYTSPLVSTVVIISKTALVSKVKERLLALSLST